VTAADGTSPSQAGDGVDVTRRYAGLMAVLEQPVLVVNGEALVVEANAAADSLFAGFGSAVEGRSDPLVRSVDEDYRPVGERSPAVRVLATGVPSAGQIVGIQPASGGPVRWFSVNAQRLGPGAGGDDLAVLALTDVTERKALELELTHLALHDGLTGLANRTLLVDRIGHAMARSQRRRPDPGVGVAVLFIDIDGFASVNDTLGNRVGDEILRILAQRLRSAVREEDTVSRIGGDEFVVLCDEINRADLARFCVRVTQVFSQPVICRAGDEWRTVAIGCTAGVAVARSGEDADRFLQRIDNMVKEQSAAAMAERTAAPGFARPVPSAGHPSPAPPASPRTAGSADRRHHRP